VHFACMHLAGTLIQSQFKVHLIHMCNSEYQKNVESIQDETFQSIQKGWYNLCKKMFKWTGIVSIHMLSQSYTTNVESVKGLTRIYLFAKLALSA